MRPALKIGHGNLRNERPETRTCAEQPGQGAAGAANAGGKRELLRCAFENVIRNALKYGSDVGPVEILLTERQGHATVLIRDHGPGIPESNLDAVFQPFFHLPGKEQNTSPGFGLGLAIAKRALDKHAASITLANAADGGLQVSIRFETAQVVVLAKHSPIGPQGV